MRLGRAPVPAIRQLAALLGLQRIRCGNPKTGPIFPNSHGKPLALCSIANHSIVPFLNICKRCGKLESKHKNENHDYQRDDRIPRWRGWDAARRGLGSNLYRLGVPALVIQRILRHSNVSTAASYYIKTAADDVRNAMAKLEERVAEAGLSQSDTNRTLKEEDTTRNCTIQ